MRENSKRQHPASLHASGEDYLEAILILHMKKGTVRSVDVARHWEFQAQRVPCGGVAKGRRFSHHG